MRITYGLAPVEGLTNWGFVPVLDRRPKFYGRSRRFKTYGYNYGGRSLRLFLRPKVLFVVFLDFSEMEAEMQALD